MVLSSCILDACAGDCGEEWTMEGGGGRYGGWIERKKNGKKERIWTRKW